MYRVFLAKQRALWMSALLLLEWSRHIVSQSPSTYSGQRSHKCNWDLFHSSRVWQLLLLERLWRARCWNSIWLGNEPYGWMYIIQQRKPETPLYRGQPYRRSPCPRDLRWDPRMMHMERARMWTNRKWDGMGQRAPSNVMALWPRRGHLSKRHVRHCARLPPLCANIGSHMACHWRR